MLTPVPLQYEGDEEAFLREVKFIARPLTAVTFSAGATDVIVPHTLGKIPMGYYVARRSGNAVVYDGSQSWTAETLCLRASAAVTAYILVF